MLSYEYTESNHAVPIRVALNGKVVGEIRPVAGGWQYFPKGQRQGGEVFATVRECQFSLLTPEEQEERTERLEALKQKNRNLRAQLPQEAQGVD